MTITKREVLFSVIILCVLLSAGLFIGDNIRNKASEQAEVYLKAAQITEPEQFRHGARTNMGNALVYGEFEAVDPVSLPELCGEFFYIERIAQRYSMHTRTVKEKDAEGNITIKTEIYYEWDFAGTDSWSVGNFRFMGEEYSAAKLSVAAQSLSLDSGNSRGNISRNYRYEGSSHFPVVGDLRYSYHHVPSRFSGTVLVSLADGSFQHHAQENGPVKVEYERQIADVVESAKKAGPGSLVLFWILWLLLTAGAITGFVYLDNHWLK